MQIRYWVILMVVIVVSVPINISFALGLNGNAHPGGGGAKNPDPHVQETKFDLCLCCEGDSEQLKLYKCQSDRTSESKCKGTDYDAKCCQ
jgi:hypothetical protein